MTLEQKKALANVDAHAQRVYGEFVDGQDRANLEFRRMAEHYAAQVGSASPVELERCLRRRFPRLNIRVCGRLLTAWSVSYGEALPGVPSIAVFSTPVTLQDVSRYLLQYAYSNPQVAA